MSNKRSIALFLLGIVVGMLILIGSLASIEYTNRTSFCISCHEMEQTVYKEFLKSPHYHNKSGVVAGCADCHVPQEWGAKLVRKFKATSEVYHSVVGTISTPEKFEAKRLELAERVWALMEENDSKECRNCHNQDRMDFHKQSRRAQEKMEKALLEGKTCIECHKGIAHKNPEEDDD